MRALELLDEYQQVHERSLILFDAVQPEAFHDRPIPLRQPIAFYLGHLAAFTANTLFGRGLGLPSRHPEFDRLFARGIDPASLALADRKTAALLPDRHEIERYSAETHDRFCEFLSNARLEALPGILRNGHAVEVVIEHELMHQETLMYMLRVLPPSRRGRLDPTILEHSAPSPRPTSSQRTTSGAVRSVFIDAGPATLGKRASTGADRPFGWDNEFPAHVVQVPAFLIDRHPVTNAEFAVFVAEGGYHRPDLWEPAAWRWREERGQEHPEFWRSHHDGWFQLGWQGLEPLLPDRPVQVTHAEAAAYARWLGKRLPTEAQWQRAAYGSGDRPFPWGSEPPSADRAELDFTTLAPGAVGSHRAGATPEGVEDLLGGLWEWTSTPFGPFAGFSADPAYPEYSADFFDGAHFVMKGGSCLTAARLLRPSFRNWFYWHYPHAYAGFRCVQSADVHPVE